MMLFAVAVAALAAIVVNVMREENPSPAMPPAREAAVSEPAPETDEGGWGVPGVTIPEDERPEKKPAGERPREAARRETAPVRAEPGAPEPAPTPEPAPEPVPATEPPAAPLPVSAEGWPKPTAEEVREVREPRHYRPRQEAVLTLTIRRLGLYDVPVISEESAEALDAGVIHIPETPMPWERREQKNVYLAGHRLGYSGTGSRLVFYELDELSEGDRISLRDRRGRTYVYRVSEMFVVDPMATWAVQPVRGRDMLTLQTCTPIPTFENRLIVRADRI